jgi:ABC-type lipoprotein release transport system permease subunit
VIWKIAWGSLRRHGRRSLLIVCAVALSVAVMEFVVGMMTGMREDFFETMVSSGGHLQVEHADAAEALDPVSTTLLLSDPSVYRDWFLQQPEVVRAEAILTFGALLLHDDINAPMMGIGVSPETGFFSDVRSGIREGQFLSGPTSTREILVSTRTAEMLGLAAGDVAMVLVEDSTGAPYYLDYRVAGLFRSDSGEFDDSTFLITHTDAQDLLYLEDQTREIRVVLTDDDLADTVAARFRDAFGLEATAGAAGAATASGPQAPGTPAAAQAGPADAAPASTPGADGTSRAPADSGGAVGGGGESPQNASSAAAGGHNNKNIAVRTWRDIHGGTAVLLEMFDVFMYAINLLIVLVAATVITNAILMNVFEKAPEYGMMRAVGMTGRGIFRLVIAEGVVYGVAGSVLGLAVGIPLVVWFQTHGIDFGEVMESFGMGREITTRFDPVASAVNGLFGTLVAVSGSLYAGLVSRRRTIIESIRGAA